MAENKPPEVRRREILNVALDLFSKKGYSDTTVDHICKKAKLTKGGLYWHFSSKKEILNSLVDEFCSQNQDIWKSLENITIDDTTMYNVGIGFIENNLKHGSKNRFYRVLEMESFKNRDIEAALKESRCFVHSALISFAQKILDFYSNTRIKPSTLANIMELSVAGVVQRKMLNDVELDVEDYWATMCNGIIRELKA